MNMRQQSEAFIEKAVNRSRNPVGRSTLGTYKSFLNSWILPELGDLDLSNVKISVMRPFVKRMEQDELSPASINGVVTLVKNIVRSAVDDENEPLYKQNLDNEAMDVPAVVKSEQDAPVLASNELEEAISRALGQDKALYTMLAVSGARIGEIQALKAKPDSDCDSYWNPNSAIIYVRSTFARNQFQPWTKTDAGFREIDLHPDVNTYLKESGLPKSGWLFRGQDKESPICQPTATRHLRRNGIEKGFHSFRRFRLTHLAMQNCPSQLVKFWAGHASSDISDRYVKVAENIRIRKEIVEKMGIGFELKY